MLYVLIVFCKNSTRTISHLLYLSIKTKTGDAVQRCNMPTVTDLMNASRHNPINWNAVENYRQAPNQTNDSFEEQKIAVKMNDAAFNACESLSSVFVKNVGIHGVPGSGKTHVQQYSCINAVAKGLKIITTSLQAKRNLNIGGKEHLHRLLCLSINEKIIPFRTAEMALLRLSRNPVKVNVLRQVDIIFIDEVGNLSAELSSVLDIILQKLRERNVPYGNVRLMTTLDIC